MPFQGNCSINRRLEHIDLLRGKKNAKVTVPATKVMRCILDASDDGFIGMLYGLFKWVCRWKCSFA